MKLFFFIYVYSWNKFVTLSQENVWKCHHWRISLWFKNVIRGIYFNNGSSPNLTNQKCLLMVLLKINLNYWLLIFLNDHFVLSTSPLSLILLFVYYLNRIKLLYLCFHHFHYSYISSAIFFNYLCTLNTTFT